MQTINRFSLVKRTVSFLLIYILLLDTMVPSLYAMSLLSMPIHLKNEFSAAMEEADQSNIGSEETSKETNQVVEKREISNTISNENLLSSATVMSSSSSQPEVSGFSIGSTDGMVDKFTGDFTYSVPLVDAEGYPITLTYNSNVSMLDEASWVGLGWNLNVGSIVRDMRGIPDEFNGEDIITREFDQLDDLVEGTKDGGYLNIGVGFGENNNSNVGIGLSFLGGKYTDNYLGIGKTYDLNLGGSARYSVQSNGEGGGLFLQPTINLGMSYDSKNGIGSTFGFGIAAIGNSGNDSRVTGGMIGATYNRSKHSRSGLNSQSLSLMGGYNYIKKGSNGSKGLNGSIIKSGASSTSTFTYGTATSLPRVHFNSATNSSNFELDVYAGLDIKAIKLRVGYLHQSYETESRILHHSGETIYHPAYGYFHSGKRIFYSGEYFPMMDFNRGIENEYSEEMKNLPFSVQTHDVFYINGAGLNSTFRGMRSDYGTYYDPESESTYNDDSQLFSDDNVSTLSTGAELTVGETLFSIGFGIGYSTATMKAEQASGNWNQGMNLLEFTPEVAANSFDKTIYFKGIGTVAPVDMQSWNQVNGGVPDYFDINVVGNTIMQENYLKQMGDHVSSSTLNSNHQQTFSSTYFKPNTVEELTFSGSPTSLNSYQSVSSGGTVTDIPRFEYDKKKNHMSSIDVVNENGVKYQYGIPVYGNKSDVTFSCEGRPELAEGGVSSGIIVYQDPDNSTGNTLGRGNYFDKTTLPSYAQAFLLTQVVSSDYIDTDNNGPTVNDIGNYYKFHYTRVYGHNNLYGTRFPISGTDVNEKKAFYAKGALGSTRDDLANYTYQQSEIWYTHSVETKNLIIEFHLEDRKDAYSVDENGILDDDKPMKNLSEIVVYNRIEKITNSNALPLQTIRFYYDYSLCQNAPGNLNTYDNPSSESGKLTLKEIRVFNGKSYENALSSISFDYGSGVDNPSFSYANIDGWGGHKLNTDIKPNDLYPYAVQTVLEANQSARAWKLIAINNPMGGRIEIDYESDSYAYVQNSRAMRNFDVHRMTDLFDFLKIRTEGEWDGINRYSGDAMEKTFHHNYGSLANFISDNDVPYPFGDLVGPAVFDKKPNSFYNMMVGQFDIELVPNNVIIFKLDRPISTGSQSFADEEIEKMYFKDPKDPLKRPVREIYAKMYVEIKEGVFDLVPTMTPISQEYPVSVLHHYFLGAIPQEFPSYGAMPPNANGEYEYGYVIVDPVHTGDREGKKGVDQLKKGTIAMHPMQLAALEYARAALPDKVYGSDPNSEGDLSIDWKVYFGNDMYKYMIQAGYCNNFDREGGEAGPNRSLIRLNEPDYTKYGGGARVKEIRYLDKWSAISGEYDGHYSWRYKYTTTEDRDEISNGVAAFEPMSIIDENPYNHWHTYVNIKKKFPDENKFVPGPVDYQLYPKPVVGYSKVDVEFIEAGNYGKSTTQYYTAKDYPTVSKSTTIDKSAKVSKNNIITGNVRDFYGITQGYVTETNDFHGIMRSAEVFSKNLQNQYIPISKTVYDYYGKGEQLKMADRSGNIGVYNAAIEYDIHADSKYYTDVNKFLQVGLDFVLHWTPPVFFTPSFSPVFAASSRERAFYSHTLIKHINYSAILKSVTTEYLRSINTTRTNVFDMYTGSPVVSELTDEYDDRLYQVNYPSHWKFKELRELHNVNGRMVTINLGLDGYFTPSVISSNDMLTPGDIVEIGGNILQVGQDWPWPDNGELFLMEPSDGSVYLPVSGGTTTAVIIRSARDNRLLETMQGFTTKVNPAAGVSITCPSDQILSASAISYRDRLTTDCHCNRLDNAPQYNPYHYGIHGDLVLDKQFAWQSERSSDDPHGIRFDGAYRSDDPGDPDFILFYELDGGKWNPISSPNHPQHDAGNIYQNWRPLGNVTLFDKYANAVESKDQINVYSSVLTGNGETYNSLIYAQAVNAQKRQIAFDGFEDYLVMSDDDRRCRFMPDNTHFGFFNYVEGGSTGVEIDLSNRHSGLASLKVAPERMASVMKTLISEKCYPMTPARGVVDREMDSVACPCLPSFSPTPGKYIISAWVKGDAEHSILNVNLQEGGTHTEYNFSAQGPVLDGWKRVEGVFEVTSGITHITVNLENNHISEPAFFDDLRIHPFLAGMQTTVYDPVTFLPLATHDGYNFTTFYNYDENLNLVRIRVETVEGIKTVMEQESGGQKSYRPE